MSSVTRVPQTTTMNAADRSADDARGSFGSTYGPLTGVMALLLWANLTSIAIFLGIAFCAQLEAVRANMEKRAPRFADV